MIKVFNGRGFASKKTVQLESKYKKLKSKPTLVTILVGDDPASVLYVNLKKRAAESVGAKLIIKHFPANTSLKTLSNKIQKLNNDTSVGGIMIQLPLPGKPKEKTKKLINTITPNKDVDGLRSDSPFVHPTAKAVLQVLKTTSFNKNSTVCIVGSRGMVGTHLIKELKKQKTKLIKDTKKADVVISATGKSNLIEKSDIKKGSILIDVGSPKGDIDFQSVKSTASFITPVPGGIGPVTITCLLQNLLISSTTDSKSQ